MRSSRVMLGVSIMFVILAVVFSIATDASLAAKIGFFALGFGSGIAAGISLAKRSK